MQRDFLTGSEWLYYKIYTGTASADIVLTEAVGPLVRELVAGGIIDKYFFIRYADPDFHIRLRFHTAHPSTSLAVIINAMYSRLYPYLEDRLIYDVQLGMYKRELERYGPHSIEASESLFFLNSSFVLDLLTDLDAGDPDARWLSGLLFMDKFLDDFGFDLDRKMLFCSSLAASFGAEFGSTNDTKKHLGAKFRTHRKSLVQTLEHENPIYVQQLISEHSDRSRSIIESISRNNVGATLHNLLASYIHMHCNRLFQNKQRAHEWLLYDMLAMYYRGKIAQNKKALKT